MKINSLFTLITLVFMLALTTAVSSQSTDQSNPTPVASNVLTIAGPKKVNQQYFYSFTGGPGEVTISLSVKAKSSSVFVGIKVFDAEMNTLTYHNMSADTGSPGVAKKKFEVGEKQTLVMSFNSDPSLAECKITFGGAVEFSGAPSGLPSPISGPPVMTDTGSGEVTSSTSSEQTSSEGTAIGAGSGKNKSFIFSLLDAAGQRFNIPANGKLRIEMKDGTIQEIDLISVKKILIRKN